MLGICIQRHIIGNVFYSTFTNVSTLVTFFNVFNVFKILFKRFFTSMAKSENPRLSYCTVDRIRPNLVGT